MNKVIAIFALPGVQLLDVSGPLDVFAQANIEAGKDIYSLKVIGCDTAPIQSSSGVRLLPDIVATKDVVAIDTLLIAGAPNASRIDLSSTILKWLRKTATSSRRYGSVCTGAFLLAAAGLLDGRHITTHWAASDLLKETYPSVQIDEDALYVRDGKVRTAAGVTAGLDLALALVEEDLGSDIARRVAGQLVMYFKRPGGQLQFSRKGEVRTAGRSALQEVQRWVAAHPELKHNISSLAKRSGLSARHFARLFHAEVGLTAGAWIEATRVESARSLLENGHDTPKLVAAKCGFANADTLRRVFKKSVGVTPAEYRKQYAVRSDC